MLSAKTLMQQNQSSLTKQAKNVSSYGRGMATRVSPPKNSTPQEAQGRKMLARYLLPVETAPTIKEAGFSAELDKSHRAWVPWKLDGKACTD